MSSSSDLQSLCERGQELLMATDYIGAEAALVEADRIATNADDYDTLARLYMPLQEARRQRRQRCGEGIVKLDLIARSADAQLDPLSIVDRFPQGQLLVAGWGNVAPAARVREISAQRNLYLETLLAAAYQTTDGVAIVLVPLADVTLPPPNAAMTPDTLQEAVPSYCVVLHERDLPAGEQPGDWKTFARVMALWERLHAPFLSAADMGLDPVQKIEGYRRTIQVDYACELAHQRLSATAHQIARSEREEEQ